MGSPSVTDYEPPRIEDRTEIAEPLVGGTSGTICASFNH
jgi:hypothetical protein